MINICLVHILRTETVTKDGDVHVVRADLQHFDGVLTVCKVD